MATSDHLAPPNTDILVLTMIVIVAGKKVQDRTLVLLSTVTYTAGATGAMFLWTYDMPVWRFLLVWRFGAHEGARVTSPASPPPPPNTGRAAAHHGCADGIQVVERVGWMGGVGGES